MIKDEKGSISIILVLIILSVGTIMFTQTSQWFDAKNKLHKRKRHFVMASTELRNLSLMLKKSYSLGKMDSTCASGTPGATPLKPITIKGHTLCVPQNNGFCINDHDSTNKICSSNQLSQIQITTSPPPAISRISNAIRIKGKRDTSSSPMYSGQSGQAKNFNMAARTNRITVPNTTSRLWKSCHGAGNLCLKVLICPRGMTNCNANQAVGSQVIQVTDI